MPDFEFKVLKMPHNRQEFYSYSLRSFGWQVQGMQETVDRVDSYNFATSTSSGHSLMRGTIDSIPRINHANLQGSSWNTGFGTRSNMGTSRVHSLLTVTYARDLSSPLHDRLAQLESQCWPQVNAYFARVDATKASNVNWTEWQTYRWLASRGQNLLAAGTEDLPPAYARDLKPQGRARGHSRRPARHGTAFHPQP